MRAPARREPQDVQPGMASIILGVLVSSVAASAFAGAIFWSFNASTDVVGYAAGIAGFLALCVAIAVNSY